MSARERADRIRSEVPILSVLAHYGYPVRTGYDREQQFSCDLHGDGRDRKPSARVYPDTEQWYCFTCDESRDAITTVRIKERVGFAEACSILESAFKLKAWAWEPEDPAKAFVAEPRQSYDRPVASFDEEAERVKRGIEIRVKDCTFSMAQSLAFWEAFDYIMHLASTDELSESKAKQALLKLQMKTMEA